ncbi:hypothetical protein RQP46_007705 [Phenoliferia psychrophenolica]
MTGFSRGGPLSPSIIASLTRPTLPSAAVSSSTARFPDLSKPQPVQIGLSRSLSAPKKKLAYERSRSASIGSLQSVVDHSGTGAGAGGLGWLARRNSSSHSLSYGSPPSDGVSEGRTGELSPIEDEEQPGSSSASASSSWWPFTVVEPSRADKGKGRAEDQDEEADGAGEEDGKAPTRSFLQFFAGKGAVEDAHGARAAERQADLAEAELLDADFETLRIASTVEDADSSPPPPPPPPPPKDVVANDAKPTSFLPTSMFSSNPFSAAPLEGPSSLFSTFSIPNPFTTSPTLSQHSGSSPPASSLASRSRSSFSMSSAFTPPSSPPPKHIHHGRSYSSGPGTKLKDVTPMLDEEDTKAAKIEDDSHMDIFTLIKERYACPKYPIVFCHGLFGFDTIGPAAIKPLQFSYWIGVKEALESIGVEVLIGRVPAAASIEERAKVLCELIEQTFPGREVNLIGHSMGGLDARFLISRLKPTTFKVKSLTTIATPHRGSAFADFIVEDLIGSERVTALLGVMSSIGVKAGAFDDLTTTKMKRFNEETPDDPKVKYFSYGAEFEPGWSNVFRMSWGVMAEREGPNDGLVSVESSKWGEYKATLNNVNHLDLVGWVGKVRFGFAEWMGKPIKFKPVSFFLAIAEMLAEEGF